ncbi:MAG TPA: sensor histidine kinase [Caulobacteraceae bacterium]|nr:sensor histidine kinase [Caulobacteraceae bacterium]
MALAPVLALSAIQANLSFRREAAAKRAELAGAAEGSTATAQTRILSAEVLLQTLAPQSQGPECAQRLAEAKNRVAGYDNLIRVDSEGRVVCAASTIRLDGGVTRGPWFAALASGAPEAVAVVQGPAHAPGAAVLAAVRMNAPGGRFDGALAAIISLEALRQSWAGAAPDGRSEVALSDRRGRYLSATEAEAFPRDPQERLRPPAAGAASVWYGRDARGDLRVFSAAPLLGRTLFLVLSSPAQGLAAWAWLNAISVIGLPLLTFGIALAAVLLVAEYGVVRWIAYLQRIAAIYARGRFTVHPQKAERAPPEIRDLAQTLDSMAQTIAARDADLKHSLTEKDSLMREIHHRVKNNLQVISSLINMQERTLTDKGARAAMSDTRQRISAIALVYRALYQGPDLKRVDLREFLDELIGQLLAIEPPGGAPVRTKLSIEPLIIDPDRLAPLALFAVEAITNAKKHALGAAGGVLSVGFHVAGAKAVLSISDTGGAGRTPTVGQGTGRALMTAFARQLQGKVAFESNSEGGLTARLTFPNPSVDADMPAPMRGQDGAGLG